MQSRTTLITEFLATVETVSKRARAHHLRGNMLPHTLMCILHVIAANGPTNIKNLANNLGFTSSATTQSVNVLVKDGLLKRVTDETDRRQITITLTTKGTAALKKAHAIRLKIITVLCTSLTDKNLMTVTTILKKLSL